MGYALRRMWLPQGVASLLWNQWQVCRGMRGNFAMESVASFAWNRWQLSYGTGGNFRMEQGATFVWNRGQLSRGIRNIVAQDHRGVKRVTRPMLGFKSFEAAQSTLTGIALMHMLRKGQLTDGSEQGRTAAEQFYALAA
jgi:hypothetical protein